VKMIDLARTTYYWVPGATTIADVSKPKLTELTGSGDSDTTRAYNISEFVVNSTEIMAAASDTTDERSVVATGNARTPTIGNYSGQLNLFRDAAEEVADGATTIWSENDLAKLFPRKGIAGFIVKRTGLPWRTPLAEDQEVEVYGFVTDTPSRSGGTQDGYLKLMIPLLPTGDFEVTAVIV